MSIRSKLLKLSIISFFCASFVIYLFIGSQVSANSFPGPIASVTGAPGEGTCAACHGGGPGGGNLTIGGLPANYTPNQEIIITVTLMQAGGQRYGFELTAIDDSGARAGDLTPNDNRSQLQLNSVGGNVRQYINHTFGGTSPSGSGVGSWSFRWKAPAQSVGRITFYAAGNAANGSGDPTGDSIYTKSESIQSLTVFASVSAASFAQTLASESIAAGFGANLADGIVHASTVPLPTELGGAQVRVKDAAGTEINAGLFFAAPGQINYLLPPNLALGPATITVRRGGVDVAQGIVQIVQVNPALFSANANGRGVAAANVFRIKASGEQTTELLAQFNPALPGFEPLPIDLGPDTDQVFFIGYGTGLRNNPTGATCTIGGVNAEVLFVGKNNFFEGLDQMNVRIPRSLAGRGNVDVVCTLAGKTFNTVNIAVR
ncbi:MAG: hypothetical protein L0226_12385 [Acidobacteria bacterium]|nr:hypothetical protein [Acidobacteriota bacterium]